MGDFAINDGWIYVEVRKATHKEVGVNYWDVEANKQVTEGKVTVDINANNVNSSQLTDIPEGYELVYVGDFAINDGWIYVEVRPAAENPDPNPGDEGTDDTDDGDEGTTGGGTTTTGGTAATAAVLGARVDAPAAPEAGVLGERVEQPAAEAGVLGERKSADTADNTPVGVWTALAGTAVAALAAFGLKRKKEEK